MRQNYRLPVLLAALALGLTALWLPPPASAVPIASSSMKQWEVKDIVLCAQLAYADWQAYQTVRVSAAFTGPGGATLNVNGFWDGKNIAPCAATAHAYRVRFTPTAQGTWNFSISNNQGDAGLTVLPAEAGAITVNSPGPSPAGKTPRGFLRRNANFPSSFVWDNNERQYLWGQTYYQVVNAEVSNLPSWKTAVDNSTLATSSTYNMSKIRLLIAPWDSDGGTVDSQPYKQIGGVLNQDQLNIPHWQALDRVVKYLNERNVVAEIILMNNPEGKQLLGTPVQDCRYLRYAASRYAAYPNVIWSLANEWQTVQNAAGTLTASYWDGLGCAIRGCTQSVCTGSDFAMAADPWFTSGLKLRGLTAHPKAMDPVTEPTQCFAFASSTWPVHASLQAHKRNSEPSPFQGDRRGYDSIACNRIAGACTLPSSPLPVINDEYGYLGVASATQEEHRNAIWGIATGGGYGTAGDFRTSSPPIRYSTWAAAPEYDDIKRLVAFFTSSSKAIEYWKMVPQTACLANTRVHTLADPSKQYVTYTADGLPFSVNGLTLGNYQRIWYNPRTANANNPNDGIDQGCVNIAVNNFTPPAGSPGDWVLLLKKTPTCL